MTPKEYFLENFDNAILDNSKKDISDMSGVLVESFSSLLSYEDTYEALSTNFPYSNDYGFNKAIESLKEGSYYNITDSIFVGKLGNLMPNCYTVNSDGIDGCLICYTTGMSENANLFAQALVSFSIGDLLDIDKDVLDLYRNLLMLELERRILGWYGGQIVTNKLLVMAVELLKEDNIFNIVLKGSNYSILMDTILIFHEYAHYVLRTFMNSKDLGLKMLTIMTVSLYSKLCQEIPEMNSLPRNEIMADLMSLLLLTNRCNLDQMEILSVFIAFLQLKRMSAEDKYTNEHRLKVIHYFFKDNQIYQQCKDSVEYYINFFSRLFDHVNSGHDYMTDLLQSMVNNMKSIIAKASLPNNQKKEIIKYYLELEVGEMKRMFSGLEKENSNIDPSDFEDF